MRRQPPRLNGTPGGVRCIILPEEFPNLARRGTRPAIIKLKRAAKQERKLIETEEKAEQRLLKARTRHEKAVRTLQHAAERQHEAEDRLRAAQRARSIGPEGNEKPSDG